MAPADSGAAGGVVAMADGVLFADLDESPIFAARVEEVKDDLEKISTRLDHLVKGSRRYVRALEAAHDATIEFSRCVKECCVDLSGADATSGASPPAGVA